MTEGVIACRIFVVGCPRSGTTLLQSLLGAHPAIASFPESHFFAHLLPHHPVKKLLGLASRGAGGQFARFLHDVGETPRDHLRGRWFTRQYAREFVAVLDRRTRQQGKTNWLEKTPGHLHAIPVIRRLVPQAKFLHLIRNGADVVASLYDVTRRHPGDWGAPRSVDDCIRWWMGDVRLSLRYRHDPDHLLVRYERLVARPRDELVRLCGFIGVPFDERMLIDYPTVASHVVLDREPWKAEAGDAIRATAGRKLAVLFTEVEQERIRTRVAAISLDGVEELQV